jgi:predicted amidohydrolase
MSFRVALLQLAAYGADIDANLIKGEEHCRRAAAMNADVALFPEMWSIGYSPCPAEAVQRKAWQQRAIGRDDRFVTHFQRLAQELDMAIAITYLERWSGAPRNSVSIIDRKGNVVMTYAKVHTCDFGMEAACTPGDDFYVCDLDTRAGNVKVGAMICYDREFPESARILMLPTRASWRIHGSASFVPAPMKTCSELPWRTIRRLSATDILWCSTPWLLHAMAGPSIHSSWRPVRRRGYSLRTSIWIDSGLTERVRPGATPTASPITTAP